MPGTPQAPDDRPVSTVLDGPGTTPRDPGAVEVVRSEEQLQVGRAVRVSERGVLRRYVVTETVTQTFQVRREEVRLDLEPVDPAASTASTASANASATGETPFGERVIEVVLHREVPLVQLRVEATELVRLHIDTVTTQVPVSAELRKEQVALDATETPDPLRPPDTRRASTA